MSYVPREGQSFGLQTAYRRFAPEFSNKRWMKDLPVAGEGKGWKNGFLAGAYGASKGAEACRPCGMAAGQNGEGHAVRVAARPGRVERVRAGAVPRAPCARGDGQGLSGARGRGAVPA